ncbi:hypothetical protein CDD83_2439 [Cordyceps sp. RAO-2017]|nr:hypothetical protein CDD83_2439 [Cordyceps sp. RAO-2017]
MDDRGEYSSGMKRGIPKSHLRLAANLPLAEEAIGRSFICEAELAASILTNFEEPKVPGTSSSANSTKRRRRESGQRSSAKHRKFSSVLDDSKLPCLKESGGRLTLYLRRG